MLFEYREEAARLRFLAKPLVSNRLPKSCFIDKIGMHTAGLAGMNNALRMVGKDQKITAYQSKYRNNIVKQDHRGV